MPGLEPSRLSALSDPSDLAALRAALAAEDPQGRLVPLGLQRVVIGLEAVHAAAKTLAAELDGAPDGPIVLLVDATPIRRAGDDLKTLVEDQVRGRFGARREVRRVVLRGHHPTLHVDDGTIAAAVAGVAGAAAVVSVGGGTITDIAKLAAGPDRPLVVVQTAASVDGYTDNVSVVLRDGVKRTVASRWPDVVVADVTTIAAAPPRLNTAGYGEVLSMFTAPADWYLASVVGLDRTFHRAPRDLLVAFGRGIADWSPGLADHDLASVEQLTRMLAVRGIATGVAGTTACLSGTEHLISHMLDMHHGAIGRPIGLHGAQVGVASVIAAAAWEHLFAVLDAGRPPHFPDAAAIAARRSGVLAAFAHLDATGRVGEECWRDYSAKLARWSSARPGVEAVFADWARHRAEIEALLVDPRTLGAGLAAAGAVTRFADLDPAVDADTARWAVAHCHLMRDRFTVVDLLDLLGHWTEADQVSVTESAAAAVDVARAVAP